MLVNSCTSRGLDAACVAWGIEVLKVFEMVLSPPINTPIHILRISQGKRGGSGSKARTRLQRGERTFGKPAHEIDSKPPLEAFRLGLSNACLPQPRRALDTPSTASCGRLKQRSSLLLLLMAGDSLDAGLTYYQLQMKKLSRPKL